MTDEQFKIMVEMWPDHTVKQIARATKLKPGIITSKARDYRHLCPRKKPHTRITEHKKTRIVSLRKCGMTIDQIAEEVGCHKNTVRNWLKKEGMLNG
jgi:DNA-binding transcriptional regulator YiaG